MLLLINTNIIAALYFAAFIFDVKLGDCGIPVADDRLRRGRVNQNDFPSADSCNTGPHSEQAVGRNSQTNLPSASNDWVHAFCSSLGHEFYVEVPQSFIEDPVTTSVLCYTVESPYLDAAIQMINGNFSIVAPISEGHLQSINIAAEELYNMLHARYVTTTEGLRSIRSKYEKGVYGQCPRVFCRGHPLLPVGMHDRPKRSSVKCFCPKCRDIYHPLTLKHRSIDGAAFGTTLPHLLLQRFNDLAPTKPKDHYVPRIFGFKLHESALELQTYNSESTL
jgi:casein kinase II subunit beta